MPDHTSTYQERKKFKGKHSEDYAIPHFESRNIPIIRVGLDSHNDDIPSKLWMNIPKLIRNIPDFIVLPNEDGNYFLECKTGREYVGLKLSELKSYGYWNEHLPVAFFIYSKLYNTVYTVSYVKIMELISEQNYKIGEYNNNERYYIIPMKDLHLKGEMYAKDGYYLNKWNQSVKIKGDE
tara:strand:+ start:195 stop:734 length:540 start_codon:yes stop_codon:yes gene_type:complete